MKFNFLNLIKKNDPEFLDRLTNPLFSTMGKFYDWAL